MGDRGHCEHDGHPQHPQFGSQDQFATIKNVSNGTGWHSQNQMCTFVRNMMHSGIQTGAEGNRRIQPLCHLSAGCYQQLTPFTSIHTGAPDRIQVEREVGE